ncbi:MAG: protein kinase [Woeseiaceae bacterium]|nr:protein kinase [Woeseiaceae bacterium]
MSAKFDKLNPSDTEQFSDLANRLQNQVQDETVLAEIHVAIKQLLSNNRATETRILEILQRRFDSGDLRPETFELVHKMLERIRTDRVSGPADGTSTLVLGKEPEAADDGAYAKTLVIGNGTPAEDFNNESPMVNTAVIGDEDPAARLMDSRQLQVGSVLRDRFLLQQELQGAGTGVVYKALDQRLADTEDDNAFVGIKVLPSEISHNERALRALQQEVAKSRCLNHPNIMRCMDLDREDDLNFIVMEWLEGKTLATILQETGNKNIDLATTMDIVKQVSLALEHAHQRGVIHGDVNPSNVRITREGEVKVFDFGIARVLQKEQDRQPDFDPRELGAKSPEYSSMQVLTGEDPVPADDVFSLGCLMYRLIAGHRVFGPRSAAEAASEGMEPQQPPGLPKKQWSALKKALAYSRVPRFKSPKEFVEALDYVPPPANGASAPTQNAPEQTAEAPAATTTNTELSLEETQTVPPMPPPGQQPAQSAPPAQQAPPPQQAQQPPQEPFNPVKLSDPFEKPQLNQPRQATATAAPAPTASQPVPPPQAPSGMELPQPRKQKPEAKPEPQPSSHDTSRVVVADEPLAPRRFDIEPRGSRWGLIVVGIIIIGAGTFYLKPELFDRALGYVPPTWIEAGEDLLGISIRQPLEVPVAEAPAEEPAEVPDAADLPTSDQPAEEQPEVAEAATEAPATEDTAGEAEVVVDAMDDEVLLEDEVPLEDPVADDTPQQAVVETEAEAPAAAPEIDQAQLLPADLTVGLVATGQFVPEIEVTLREDEGDVTIDLVRMHNMREPLTVLLEEVGFSGNRSPWEEGQYVIANNGIATFEAGKNRVRTRISMSTDSVREADRDVTIQVREIDNAEAEFARINLKLEDDDRRAYEASLPLDTVAFTVSELFVSEADPAVQIEVVRFKPSNRGLEVGYVVNDLTTTAGEDYFPPGVPSIYFSPNQRSARILIPLVQDSDPEDSEVFAIEFRDPARYLDPDIYQTIAIMIRDDD